MDVFEQIRVSVGIAIGKVNRVVSVFEVIRKSMRVVVAHIGPFFIVTFANLVLVVGDLRPTTVPADVLQSRNPLTVHKNLHTLIV